MIVFDQVDTKLSHAAHIMANIWIMMKIGNQIAPCS